MLNSYIKTETIQRKLPMNKKRRVEQLYKNGILRINAKPKFTNETNKYSRKRNYSNKIEAVSNEAKEKPVK